MTWGTAQGDDDAFTDMGIPDEDLMQLSDEQLGQLLGAEGATVPVMLDDAELTAAFARAAEAEAPGERAVEARELPPRAPPGHQQGPAPVQGWAVPGGAGGVHRRAGSAGHGAHPVAESARRARRALARVRGRVGFAQRADRHPLQLRKCCYSRLDDTQSGLVSLVRAMEAGYDDYQNIRADPDIAPLRADARFEGIVARFEPQGALEGSSRCSPRAPPASRGKPGGAEGRRGGELIGGLFNAVKGEDEEVTDRRRRTRNHSIFVHFLFTSVF